MSVCNQCLKTTADSNEKNDRTMFLNLSDSYVEYAIFDTDMSIVESNDYKECNDISSNLALMKLK